MEKVFVNTIKYFSALVVIGVLASPLSVGAAGITYDLVSFITPTSIEDLIVFILDALIVVAIPIIVFFIIYAGFMYVTARGNAEQVKSATRSLTYAIIGGILIIGAVALSAIVENVVTAFTA